MLQKTGERRISRFRFPPGFPDKIAGLTPHILYVYSRELHQMLYINPRFYEMIEYQPQEFENIRDHLPLFLFHPEDRWIPLDTEKKLQEAREGDIVESRFRLITKNGKVKYFKDRMVVFSRFPTGDVKEILGVLEDITVNHMQEEELERRRRKIFEQARMTSIGELADSIFHEVNNPLAIVKLTLMQLRKAMDKDPCAKEELMTCLERLEKNTERISTIVKGLHLFSSDGDEQGGVFLKDVVESLNSLVVPRMRHCGIDYFPPQDGKNVHLDIPLAELMQVCMHLIQNSIDAIHNEKTKWIKILTEDKGDIYQLRIVDSGPALPQDIVDKLMTPFFSTKESGKGTGLGLYISSSTLVKYKGELTYEPFDGHTSFLIRIPIRKHS